jgi:hypothetical protein
MGRTLFLLMLLATVLPAPADVSPVDLRRLSAGEVLVTLGPAPRSGGPREGIGRGVIDAPPERVYRALTDWAHAEEWMPFVERSDAVPQPDGSVVSFQALDLPAPLGDRHYKIRARAGIAGGAGGKARVWRTRWSYVPGSGNVDDHRGSWELTSFGDGRTLATCRLYTDPGGSVPAWMMDRATRKSLPWIFDGLRQHVRRSRYDAP